MSFTQQIYCGKKETIITKPLVVSIGISKYGKSIPDIDDIKQEIGEYTKTFSDSYNYTVVCNKFDQFCSRQTIENYLNETCNKYLINDDRNIYFNCLIITISGHCSADSLLCSDGRSIKFHDILSIFTASGNNKYLSSKLPKLLIVDGNRGFTVSVITTKPTPSVYNYACIISSTSTMHSSVYGGQIAWNVCQIFEQYKRNSTGLLLHAIFTNLKQRLSQSLYQNDASAVSFIADPEMNVITFRFRANKQSKCKHSQNGTVAVPIDQAPKPPHKIPLKAPSKQAPTIPFADQSKWNKTFKILTREYEKTRVRIEWLFVLNNISHTVIMTHSQKRKPSIISSRALYVDGVKIYSNRSRDNLFKIKIDKHCLTFKIGRIDEKYKYLLCIDKLSHQTAYKEWKEQQRYNTNRKTKSEFNSIANIKENKKHKSNWFRNTNTLPVFSPLFNTVPDRSFESLDDTVNPTHYKL